MRPVTDLIKVLQGAIQDFIRELRLYPGSQGVTNINAATSNLDQEVNADLDHLVTMFRKILRLVRVYLCSLNERSFVIYDLDQIIEFLGDDSIIEIIKLLIKHKNHFITTFSNLDVNALEIAVREFFLIIQRNIFQRIPWVPIRSTLINYWINYMEDPIEIIDGQNNTQNLADRDLGSIYHVIRRVKEVIGNLIPDLGDIETIITKIIIDSYFAIFPTDSDQPRYNYNDPASSNDFDSNFSQVDPEPNLFGSIDVDNTQSNSPVLNSHNVPASLSQNITINGQQISKEQMQQICECYAGITNSNVRGNYWNTLTDLITAMNFLLKNGELVYDTSLEAGEMIFKGFNLLSSEGEFKKNVNSRFDIDHVTTATAFIEKTINKTYPKLSENLYGAIAELKSSDDLELSDAGNKLGDFFDRLRVMPRSSSRDLSMNQSIITSRF